MKPVSTKPQQPGNYIDAFVKKMFGRVLVFTDFLVNYADKRFVAEIDVTQIQPVSSHYIGQKGDERIVDLVFQCPLKSGTGNLLPRTFNLSSWTDVSMYILPKKSNFWIGFQDRIHCRGSNGGDHI